MDILLHQYPSLRVAFIDTFHGAQGVQQYSVLIRGQVGTPASDPEGTQELYRCAWGSRGGQERGQMTQPVCIRVSDCGKRADPCGRPRAHPCRVRLPKNGETGHGVVLGEGKPENQNAAIIFCFGEVVQVRRAAGGACGPLRACRHCLALIPPTQRPFCGAGAPRASGPGPLTFPRTHAPLHPFSPQPRPFRPST